MNMSSNRFIVRNLRSLGFTAMLIGSAPALAVQEAHVHGEGHVNIAIEGDRLNLELEAPGADLVGFEYAANSADEIAAVARAIARLQDPMQIMRFDTDANCRVISATAGVEVEEADHKDHKHDDDNHAQSSVDTASQHSEEEEGHNEYRAEYELQCANINALKSIEFTYFEHFPNAEILDIVLIIGNGQQQQDLDRSNPVLILNR